MKKKIKFWWQSGLRIQIQIQITTLVRHALTDVCTVPVLLFCDKIRMSVTNGYKRNIKLRLLN